ncbi:MAG TPA: PAS domain-containing protein [Sphingomicrobium sp.]|nr:PAS domain-containing protein [Sphingomicrobium sp.]
MASSGKSKLTAELTGKGKPGAAAPVSEPGVGGLPEHLPKDFFTGRGMLALADMLPVMLAFVDRDYTYRFLNKGLAEWFGMPRSKILGRTIRELLGETAWEHREPMLKAAMGGERQFFVADYEHERRGPAAVQVEYVPWKGSQGKIDGVVILVNDVTEQRVGERALRESEERFRRIANQAPALMWVTRLDRTRDFVNDAYMEWLGTDDREFARTFDWRQLIHPDDVERIVAESVAGEASLQTFTLEGRFRRGDGNYRWLKSVSSPRFGPDGEHIGFIGVASDITLAKEAELELRRLVEERTAELALSEARFRAVFETALEVMVLIDPDGTVLALNHRREAWRHPNPDEAIGKKFWETPTLQAYPEHIEVVKEGIRLAASGETFTSQVVMERPGVPAAYLDVAFQPVRDPDGKVIYILFEARDITDLKAAQEQLRQSQKMEALGQLTGGIAHDFNNLLTVVVGGLDMVAKKVEDGKLKRYATNALTAAERGARLTGQLLAFSRVQRLEVRPVRVSELIQDMRPLLRNVLGPGIAKEFNLDDHEVPVMADPTQLEVAVLNLAINARDAMPGGGVLTFATRPSRIAGDPELDDGDYVELCINDTGTGMPPEVASRAFEPFFTTKEVGKGTGLGLSMVYGMARQSGGTARIDTAPGKGTTIKLYFKAAEAIPDDFAVDKFEECEAGGKDGASILVIDDDPDVRGFVAEALADQGFRVRECADGHSGLAEFAKDRPDLVVLDFVMPAMSGAEVAKRILEDQPGQKILFVSGYSETEAIRRIAPNSPLLSKPFRSDALCRAARMALS